MTRQHCSAIQPEKQHPVSPPVLQINIIAPNAHGQWLLCFPESTTLSATTHAVKPLLPSAAFQLRVRGARRQFHVG
eukprot:CAMPEP_0198205148 /NCGR_PEP_ID=MMETSP1445-20131203/8631_1 /TAXON_ID=36898 /ORGANISM="Pyramimonas sp., Strain CCMP2087" /LENGTH=75 /DNA_ID=CAMNT_0043877311 /DNA_START=63 /DNA_END=286 /DNA_ORIENTATION=+